MIRAIIAIALCVLAFHACEESMQSGFLGQAISASTFLRLAVAGFTIGLGACVYAIWRKVQARDAEA